MLLINFISLLFTNETLKNKRYPKLNKPPPPITYLFGLYVYPLQVFFLLGKPSRFLLIQIARLG